MLQLDDGRWLSFLDQRTFGGLAWDHLTPDASGQRAVPASLAHIGADPFEATYDPDLLVKTIQRKHSEIKRVLLDQSVVSGIGNIYADEALWRAQVHPGTFVPPTVIGDHPQGAGRSSTGDG